MCKRNSQRDRLSCSADGAVIDYRKDRKERLGSFLQCEKTGRLCVVLERNIQDCDREVCFLDDPEYIKLQARIEAKTKETKKKKKTEETWRPLIEQQKKNNQEMIARQKIGRLKREAMKLYNSGQINAGDEVIRQIEEIRRKEIRK